MWLQKKSTDIQSSKDEEEWAHSEHIPGGEENVQDRTREENKKEFTVVRPWEAAVGIF